MPLLAMISYQSKDHAISEVMHEEIALRGFTVIHDRCSFQSGVRIQREMAHGVESCDAFVAYLTPNSLYLSAQPGSTRPALDNEFIPVMHRYLQSAGEPGSTTRPLILPVTHGLGSRAEAAEYVRVATGEDISSLWLPNVEQDSLGITQSGAAAIARAGLLGVLKHRMSDLDKIDVLVVTRGTGQEPRFITVDGTMLFGGETRRPGAPGDWQRLVSALRDLEAVLAQGKERRIDFDVKAHLSAALAVGRVFNQAAGWKPEVLGRFGYVEPSTVAQHVAMHPRWDPGSLSSSDVVVEIDLLGHPVAELANDLIRRLPSAVRGRLQLIREASGELAPNDVADLAELSAQAIRRMVSTEKPARVHLLCASPVEFAVLLGYRLTALYTDLQLYERDENSYVPSVTLGQGIP